MIRLLLVTSLLLTGLFGLLIGGLRVQPQENPALAVFGDCAFPCWQGLKIGTSSADEAVARINAIGRWDVSQTPCYISDFCILYSWHFPKTQALYAYAAVNYGQIATIDSVNPGFTIAQALIVLKVLPVDGGDLNIGVAGQFHVNLYFAGGTLVLTTTVPCPGTYRDVLEAPVRVLELEAADSHGQFPHPLLTFPEFRRAFNRVCRPLQ